LLVLDTHGCFRNKEYAMVPYQHHSSKHTWKVFTSKKTFHEDVVDFETGYSTVFAKSAREAAQVGMEYFKRSEENTAKYEQWLKEEAAKKVKKQLQRKDDGSK
jgi:hypothetical protein